MKITIFGATGMVGKHLVRQALYAGHEVRAFGRNVFTEKFPEDPKLEIIQGAVFDEKQVSQAVSGADAVLSVLGGGVDGSDKTRSLGMKNIVAQMEKSGVTRIVALGGLGVLPSITGKMKMDEKEFPKQFLPVSKEHLGAYEELKRSGLNWTFVCAPDIHDHEATGNFLTAAEASPGELPGKISAGDLALFMLKELEKNEFNMMRAGIANY